MSAETAAASDFACSLDHAQIRWYGRVYICSAWLCFAGSGISLSGGGGMRGCSQGGQPAGQAWRSELQLPLAAVREGQADSERSGGRRSEWRRSVGSYPFPTQLSVVAADTDRHGQSGGGGQASRKLVHRAAVKIAFCDVTRISKELTLGVCPNAVTVSTDRRQFIFTDLVRRDRAYHHMTERWAAAKAALADHRCRAPPPPPPPPKQEEARIRCTRAVPPARVRQRPERSWPASAALHAPTADGSSSSNAQVSSCPHILAAIARHGHQHCAQPGPLGTFGTLAAFGVTSRLVGEAGCNTRFAIVSIVVFCLITTLV
ncbi:hypothetical protein LPJ61_002853 [Coemansia biformis]|uniref:Uncharacterized protein n=1 Tax=Coemansia biformis TaxID=1286918 RepID=A0A9W7YCI4_9FUNG|nr:hypothetical protein LPJ61_002853 [Coemansia biformis]